MTAKRDLKKRIRERAARTGERYTTARSHVLRETSPTGEPSSAASPGEAISVIELVDLSEKAASLGIRCQILVHPDLLTRVDPTELLASLLRAVRATLDDPDTENFRAVVMRGEAPTARGSILTVPAAIALRRFIARAQAGIGGPSPGGHLLAFHMAGRDGLETVLCSQQYAPQVPASAFLVRRPGLILATPPPVSESLLGGLEGFFL